MAACLAHILPLVYHCLNSWQVVQWIWIILDSQMNHSQRHTVHTQAYCHKKNEERNKPKRIHIHTVGQWFSTTRPWPGTGLYCACNWAAKMLCDKGRQLLQKKNTALCRLFCSYLQWSMFLQWGPCHSPSCCYILKTAKVYLKADLSRVYFKVVKCLVQTPPEVHQHPSKLHVFASHCR